ncbi:TetR/AcrR family transcriptional regulator [Saccharothrix sp. AJ9571]|nr:TetR/AcrR family transcriptional regulator [Saccharothrix sp. AJ9571]
MSRAKTGKARMGRPSLVDRDTIVRAAVDLGFDRLTVSAVSARLGVSHSTLYRYFGSRDALASAAIDLAVSSIEWPAPDDQGWHAFLQATAKGYWSLYETHPGLALEVSTLRSTSSALVATTNQAGLALIEFGFTAEQAVLVVDMLGELVTQAFLGASTSPPVTTTPPAAEEERPHTVSVVDGSRQRRAELMQPWLDHYDPRLRAAFAEAISRPPAEQFARKLALFLDGIAARIPRSHA